MNEKYNALFTPWKIGNVEIKNRIVQCSMGGTSLFGWMEPNHFDKEAAYFLLNRAQDGVGLILPGMQCIRDPLGIPGRKWLYQNDQMFKQLKEYMVEFHKTGAKLFIQLAAGMGRSMVINGWMTKLAKNHFHFKRKKAAASKKLQPFLFHNYYLFLSDCFDLAKNALWKRLNCYAASSWLRSKVLSVYFVECCEIAHIC